MIEVMNGLQAALPAAAWKVSLDDNNKLEWTGLDGDESVTHTKEPMTSWWDRFMAGFYRILPIRSQL